MSAQARPISPTRFASALQGLALPNLYGKVAELRNQLAHLDYSNQEMLAFAEGTAPGLTEPDKECAAAIEENEAVIRRILERLALLRSEIEERGCSWLEGQADEELRLANGHTSGEGEGVGEGAEREDGIVVNPAAPERSGPWADGTFTTGRFVNGEVVMDRPEETAAEARRVLGNSTPTEGDGGASGVAQSPELASRPRVNGSGTDEATTGPRQPAGSRTSEEDEEDEGIHL